MTKKIATLTAVLIVAANWYGSFVYGQSPTPTPGAGGGAGAIQGQPDLPLGDSTGQEQYEELRLQMQILKLQAEHRAKAKEESLKLIKEATLPCELIEAKYVGANKIMNDGASVDTHIDEVSCVNGVGYIIESQGTEKPRIVSCFAAEAAHANDSKSNRKNANVNFQCQLAGNKDIRATASSLLAANGITCEVNNVRWFGIAASKMTEYTEVACADGVGYLLKIPLAPSTAAISAMNCKDAAAKGLHCHLTDAGPVAQPITMQTYIDALKQHGVQCDPTQLRVIGQEKVYNRYVVEAQCLQQSQGLVAYIPLEGNQYKFEAIDCSEAKERNIQCKYVTKQ